MEDSKFTAIDKTGNQTGKMGAGDYKGGGAGGDKMNQPNPYHPGGGNGGKTSHGGSSTPSGDESY